MDQNVEVVAEIIYCERKKRSLGTDHHANGNRGGIISTKRGVSCLVVTVS